MRVASSASMARQPELGRVCIGEGLSSMDGGSWHGPRSVRNDTPHMHGQIKAPRERRRPPAIDKLPRGLDDAGARRLRFQTGKVHLLPAQRHRESVVEDEAVLSTVFQ